MSTPRILSSTLRHSLLHTPLTNVNLSYHTTSALHKTILQSIRSAGNRKKDMRPVKKRSPKMNGKPQRKATVVQLFERSPKKPNSARRRCCRLKLNETGQFVQAYIPGEGHRLQKHAIVLVRGGPVRDLIGMKLKVVRGALDAAGVEGRQTRRSIYGSKKVAGTNAVAGVLLLLALGAALEEAWKQVEQNHALSIDGQVDAPVMSL